LAGRKSRLIRNVLSCGLGKSRLGGIGALALSLCCKLLGELRLSLNCPRSLTACCLSKGLLLGKGGLGLLVGVIHLFARRPRGLKSSSFASRKHASDETHFKAPLR
jgi:hypothetical protein